MGTDSATTMELEFVGCYVQLAQAEGALELARTGAVLSAGEEEEPAPNWSVECIVDRSLVCHLELLPGPASPASLEEFLQRVKFPNELKNTQIRTAGQRCTLRWMPQKQIRRCCGSCAKY